MTERYIYENNSITDTIIQETIELTNYDEIIALLNQKENQLLHYEKRINELSDENEQLKQDRFICLDCKYCGHTEIGCLCEKQDDWEEFKSECNDFKELKYYGDDVE